MDDIAVSRLLGPIMRRIRLMIGRAAINQVDDSLKAQNMQASILDDEEPDDVERLQNYGQISVPLPGAEALIVCVGADRDSAIALVVEDRRYRPTDLTAGDTGVYHYEGHRIRLTKDGRCIITCKTLEIYADESATVDTPLTTFTKDVVIEGGLKVKGKSEMQSEVTAPDVILDGKSTKLHRHKENGDGGGITDPMQ